MLTIILSNLYYQLCPVPLTLHRERSSRFPKYNLVLFLGREAAALKLLEDFQLSRCIVCDGDKQKHSGLPTNAFAITTSTRGFHPSAKD